MVPFMTREANAQPASGRRKVTKPRRGVTKEDISRPTLLPWEGSQSVPRDTSIPKDTAKAHKRSQSAPLLTGGRRLGSPFRSLLNPNIARVLILPAWTSTDTSGTRQMDTQSIQIIFPQINKDKSLPPTPCLEHPSLGAAQFPNFTFPESVPNLGASHDTEQEVASPPIFCATMEDLLDQNTAKLVESQFSDRKEVEDAQDMYVEAASLFEELSMDIGQIFEHTHDDTSMILPASDGGARSTIYSLFIGDDSTAHVTTSEGDDSEPRSRPYVAPKGTFLARFSKCLDDADIPYKITKSERVITSPGFPEKDKLESMGQTSVPDVSGDIIVQVYRHVIEDFEEELLAKEIIFTRGSSYVHHRHSRQRSADEANAFLLRRQGELFHSNFLRPGSTALGAEEILGFLVQEFEEKEALVDEFAEKELLAKDLIVKSLERKFNDANTYDSDEDRVPSEY